MALKFAMIVLPPLIITLVVLCLVDVSWDVLTRVAAVLVVFLVVIVLCNRLKQLSSPWQQQEAGNQAMADPPHESAALGLGASAIAGLPVYKYKKKSGGGGGGSDECSICLGEIKQQETVKQLPVFTHLFHEGCIDVWLRSHRTCPVCRSPVIAEAAPVSVAIDVRHQGN